MCDFELRYTSPSEVVISLGLWSAPCHKHYVLAIEIALLEQYHSVICCIQSYLVEDALDATKLFPRAIFRPEKLDELSYTM